MEKTMEDTKSDSLQTKKHVNWLIALVQEKLEEMYRRKYHAA